MTGFLKDLLTDSREPGPPVSLGPLELRVMEIIWAQGESNVREVVEKLHRPLAYTTVMTTLDRLFKKCLLNRRKLERAFAYSASLSRHEWERRRAGALVARFLAAPARPGARDLLLSCLLDAVGEHDELEKRIRRKRRELFRRGQP